MEVATNMGRRTFSPWATNTDKNNRWIYTFHSTGGALCLSLCRSFFVNTVHIYRISIRVRDRARVKVSSTWQNTIILVAFYIMLARPVGRFFTVLRMNFPVMLIAEDICGRCPAHIVQWLDHFGAMCSRAWHALCAISSRFNSSRGPGKARPPM